MEAYATMPTDQVVRGDGELLRQLVEKRQAAAEALEALAEGASDRTDIVFSIQALEMAIGNIVQLQNLTRREEHASTLEEQRELTSNVRCLARSWATRDDFQIRSSQGQTMLGYQRDLETHFGERGRPTDSQLTAICEGREIYMGPVEEEVDVPDTEEGTGPEGEGGTEEGDGGEDSGEDAGAAIDDLLGEE